MTLSQSWLLQFVYHRLQQQVNIYEVLKSLPTFLESLGDFPTIMLSLQQPLSQWHLFGRDIPTVQAALSESRVVCQPLISRSAKSVGTKTSHCHREQANSLSLYWFSSKIGRLILMSPADNVIVTRIGSAFVTCTMIGWEVGLTKQQQLINK